MPKKPEHLEADGFLQSLGESAGWTHLKAGIYAKDLRFNEDGTISVQLRYPEEFDEAEVHREVQYLIETGVDDICQTLSDEDEVDETIEALTNPTLG